MVAKTPVTTEASIVRAADYIGLIAGSPARRPTMSPARRVIRGAAGLAATLGVLLAPTAIASTTGLDAAGATAGARAFVETSPSPDPSPSPSPSGPATVSSVATGRWSSRPVEVRLSAPGWDPAQVVTFWRLDGGEWSQGIVVTVNAPKDHSNDGLHALEFYSTDLAGVTGSLSAVVVGIDTKRPVVVWRDLSPNPVRDERYLWASLSVRDISPVVRFSYVVKDAWGHRVARKWGIDRSPVGCVLPVALRYGGGGRLHSGLYRVTVKATDRAGNRATARTRVFRIHRAVSPTVWFRVGGAGNRVALTFDDGYSASAWSSILTTLRARGVHATFFVNGVHVAAFPSLARRTVAAGHAIGSHGYSHAGFFGLSAAEIYQEVARDRSIWWSVARASPLPFVRTPFGIYDATVLYAVGQAGYARVIVWDVDPADWQGPPSSTIVGRVLSCVRPGSIVLMHLQPSTAAALPAIISGLRARGLRPVTLPAMFRAAGIRP